MRRVEEGKIILERGDSHICISKTSLKARHLEEEREKERYANFNAINLFFSASVYTIWEDTQCHAFAHFHAKTYSATTEINAKAGVLRVFFGFLLKGKEGNYVQGS